MSLFREWAARHGVPLPAVEEYEHLIGLDCNPTITPDQSEASVSANLRLEAASFGGLYLWRNNVGATRTLDGTYVRYGLCNDSARLNAHIKSADLIGCYKRLVTPDMVGTYIGQFISREAKRANWTYRGDDHERAQSRWAELINSLGGDACFANGPGSFDRLRK